MLTVTFPDLPKFLCTFTLIMTLPSFGSSILSEGSITPDSKNKPFGWPFFPIDITTLDFSSSSEA